MTLTRQIGLIILCIMHFSNSEAQIDCLPVEKLRSSYTNDRQFKQVMDDMFNHVQNLPDGSVNFWKNKKINDLYTFLNEWFY